MFLLEDRDEAEDEILSGDIDDDLERVVIESTASIEREVGGLKQLVDEFSKFARMPEITPQRVSFPALVESVLAALPERQRSALWLSAVEGNGAS